MRQMALIALFLILQAASSLSDVENRSKDDFDEEIYSVIDSYRDGSLWAKVRHARSIESSETPGNESFSDNSLWNDLWHRCRRKPTFSCVKVGVFRYLNRNLDSSEDLQVTDHLIFRKNSNKYESYCENSDDERERCLRQDREKSELLGDEERENEIGSGDGASKVEKIDEDVGTTNSTFEIGKDVEEEDPTEDARSAETLGDVSDILYDKGTQFLMTHNMEFQLPQTFFGGGSIRIEPKTFEFEDENGEEGTLVKIVIKPPPPPQQVIRGRLLHHLKKLFKKKLMHSFMALMLIIKMIKVKIMFLLPMIIGQSTAKKLLLKTLLFLIPGLAHLFKLCHYYHMEHAKYHHHHHKIKHHHHTVQVPVPVPVRVHHYHLPEESHSGGYNTHSYQYPLDQYPAHSPHVGDYDYHASGSVHENSVYKGSYGQYADNEAAMTSWGLGSQNYQDAGVLDAKDQPAYSGYADPSHYYNKNPYEISGYPDNSYYQNDVSGLPPGQKQFYGSKLQLLSQKPPLGVGDLHHGPDPFYSPILQRIDSIFVQMGFNDEGCRERLVCSIYKSPHRYTPHGNLLSNELSRDSSELQKPLVNNEDVLRFYRYVQAARDGQDQKDCLRLYQGCPINTEG